MKIKLFYTFILIFLFSACTLEGVNDVKSNKPAASTDTLKTDTLLSYKLLNTSALEIMQDTLNSGEENNMVWNGEQGLRIEWYKKNKSQNIALHDVVMVNYEARVARGEVYDSNSKIGQPVALKTGIGQLIEGWEKGLLQMHNGDKARIMIPSALAYGENGLLGIVPQNADIIVEIEIISIIEPILLDNDVKVFKYETTNNGVYPTDNQSITFDYFAFKVGNHAGLYDNSYEKGSPFTLKLNNDNSIQGLHIGFSTIKVNEKAFIQIPAKMAYGYKGLVDLVPSNTDLVFDVRTISMK